MNPKLVHIEELLRRIVEALVYRTEEIRTHITHNGSAALIQVWVHERDRGLLIGKGGSKIAALGALGKLMGAKIGFELFVRAEPSFPGDGKHGGNIKEPLDQESVSALLHDLATAIFDHPDAVHASIEPVKNSNLYLVSLEISDAENESSVRLAKENLKSVFDSIAKKTGNKIIMTVDQAHMVH